ncbi:MAG: hypothetical protein ACI82A_001296 [Candidatus Azotimanducaceae bacterium]|jgi:hypothetical protein
MPNNLRFILQIVVAGKHLFLDSGLWIGIKRMDMKNWLIGLLLTSGMVNAEMRPEDTVQIANQQFQAGEWQSAALHYERLIVTQPNKRLFWMRLGQSYLDKTAIAPLRQALSMTSTDGKRNQLHFALARAEAGVGSKQKMLDQLAAIVKNGGTPYLAVMAAQEFEPFKGAADFDLIAAQLKSCQSADHRAFDFWLGEWQVTSPGRVGWQASSSITLGNDGCTIHEAYTTPGGYAGTSVNFYDGSKSQWHQTWVDNQGGPLYLDGGMRGSSMVLSDGQNQITWTPQIDGRVRQHWQVTSDSGVTFTTAFDGYYEPAQ